ncbi:MAG: hypothetical protein KC417_11985 [Myxococcales bacterium]|nr:hypothetical protein [Myxococcales bacterium]
MHSVLWRPTAPSGFPWRAAGKSRSLVFTEEFAGSTCGSTKLTQRVD